MSWPECYVSRASPSRAASAISVDRAQSGDFERDRGSRSAGGGPTCHTWWMSKASPTARATRRRSSGSPVTTRSRRPTAPTTTDGSMTFRPTSVHRRSVDLLNRRLLVVENVVEMGGILITGTPKSGVGRTVPMLANLIDQLTEHLATAARTPDAPVFTGPKGAPLRYSWWRRNVWAPPAEGPGSWSRSCSAPFRRQGPCQCRRHQELHGPRLGGVQHRRLRPHLVG